MQWFPPHNHIYFQCNTVLCINFITLKLLSFFFFFKGFTAIKRGLCSAKNTNSNLLFKPFSYCCIFGVLHTSKLRFFSKLYTCRNVKCLQNWRDLWECSDKRLSEHPYWASQTVALPDWRPQSVARFWKVSTPSCCSPAKPQTVILLIFLLKRK